MNANARPFFPNGMPASEISRIKEKAVAYPRSLLDWEIAVLDDLERRRRTRGRDRTQQPVEAD
ncbi:hypothetical protein VB780_08025 [Leptolyngbya sp. CCNP1308]|uniref:hypothetical protein n=1 Tax=Leptolyngbya sp. CCNP1308 TaxID=3110255 RepID=UPI002B2215C4|nr:hypothetical protein [Leptolyngbya sp. CCNP1308]MEA5448509.1 hypothetical protein [Leptolyngbya sp. CCNP1308]